MEASPKLPIKEPLGSQRKDIRGNQRRTYQNHKKKIEKERSKKYQKETIQKQGGTSKSNPQNREKSKNRSKEAKITATPNFVRVRKFFFFLLVLRFSVLNLSLEEVLSWNLDVKALVCCSTQVSDLNGQ
ncbi:hypothetical protein H5410_014159 [Solanum commersonii]|uniref:Uncharacterized protein n=1 Tax=Solanum commersonii TaxID=4109 RepID=A0A9J5ZQL9_SOLCO|nr:hypothetical protein H5410_014159 [Solanum commersonii]